MRTNRGRKQPEKERGPETAGPRSSSVRPLRGTGSPSRPDLAARPLTPWRRCGSRPPGSRTRSLGRVCSSILAMGILIMRLQMSQRLNCIRDWKSFTYRLVLLKDIVRGVEGYIVTGSKQVEIGNKLSYDSQKYGVENTCTSGDTLSKAATYFGKARSQMEKERDNMLKAFGTQVAEPLRAMVMGAPLEDARHLAQRYDRMRQEAEAQVVEVSRRQNRVRESAGNGDMISKLEAAEYKLEELKSNMVGLGREAIAAMSAVEAQQQRLTLQRLIALVEAERAYHQRVLEILDQLEQEMVSERQKIEAPPTPAAENYMPPPPPPSYDEVNGAFASTSVNESVQPVDFFLGEALDSFKAESEFELTLSAGDIVIVRKISSNGWAEGECKGKAGWFPHAYIERRERVLASKVPHIF
ncbi:SH3 domain-containing protein 2-like isoform X1 [Miscanthus floridulus]|uniref:SH3 domain-containing protein 2-like isoform X1 n=1 Tax=Miscanthus floridulus TaxID=154761 RepID=UPI00345A9547